MTFFNGFVLGWSLGTLLSALQEIYELRMKLRYAAFTK